MPELPEVETTRRGLERHAAGQPIRALHVHEPRLRWPVDPGLVARVAGRRIRAVERRAKYLLLRLTRGTLIWHLGMSGSLRVERGGERLAHDHVELLLGSGAVVRFNDPRRFGCLLYAEGDPSAHALLRHLAPEPFDPAFDAGYLQACVRGRRTAIKQVLLNGRLVTGVGNIYASEALFTARIAPRRPARSLTREECARLVRAVRSTLQRAIRAGGTTLRDYVQPDGHAGEFRVRLNVYERTGRPCRRCHTPIRHLVQGQRSTYYCPQCQH